jgi:hypothetical protein
MQDISTSHYQPAQHRGQCMMYCSGQSLLRPEGIRVTCHSRMERFMAMEMVKHRIIFKTRESEGPADMGRVRL